MLPPLPIRKVLFPEKVWEGSMGKKRKTYIKDKVWKIILPGKGFVALVADTELQLHH